jgi:hypothetical protein
VGFLKQLAARLKNVRELTLFGQLIGGVQDGQEEDAVAFFEELGKGGVREGHFIDVFAKEGFWGRAGKFLGGGGKNGGLKLLEVSFTYRHSDEEFLTRIHAEDLLSLCNTEMVAASFNIVPSPSQKKEGEGERKMDEEDPENLDQEGKLLKKRPEGVMVLHPTHTEKVLERLVKNWKDEGEGEGLKMLGLTLFTLSTKQVGEVLGRHKGLRVLNVTVSVEKVEGWKGGLVEVLGKGEELEVVEVVVSPGLDFYLSVCYAFPLSYPFLPFRLEGI